MAENDDLLDIGEEPKGLEPLEFLRSIMSGSDPRGVSDLWEQVQAVEDENFGEPPTEEQWKDLLSTIEVSHKPRKVSLSESTKAATTLAEYENAKRKSVELSIDGGSVNVPDLNEAELDLFEEWFNDQF